MVDKTNLISSFKRKFLIESSYDNQKYSFSIGVGSKAIKTTVVSLKPKDIKEKVNLIKQYSFNGYHVVFCGKTNSRFFENSLDFQYNVKNIEIEKSFLLKSDRVLFVSLIDLFSKNIKREKWELVKTKKDISFNLTSLSELKKGDYVVHKVFGVGVFKGLLVLTTNNIKKRGFRNRVRKQLKSFCFFRQIKSCTSIYWVYKVPKS